MSAFLRMLGVLIFLHSMILYISAFLCWHSQGLMFTWRGESLNSFETCIIYLEVIQKIWQAINTFEENIGPVSPVLTMLGDLSFNVSLDVGKVEEKESLRVMLLPCIQLLLKG